MLFAVRADGTIAPEVSGGPPRVLTKAASTSRRRDRSLALILVAGGLLYSLWVLEAWLNPALNASQSFVSELSARDQPFSGVFAGADLLSAVLLCTAGVVALCLRWRGRWTSLGWSLQVVFGGISIADALARLDCAPSASTTCAIRERAGLLSMSHEAHSVTSTLAVIVLPVSMLALILAARRFGRWWPLPGVGPVLLLVQLVSSVFTLILAVGGSDLGISERVQVGCVSTWYVLLGTALWSRPRPLGKRPAC
jgi:hypothetical protein